MEQLLQEALDENTPAERLSELAKSIHYKVRKAVAQNPNTPPYLLQKLFLHFPVQVLNNSVLDLLLLEIPDFLEQLYLANRYVFINACGLPLFFVEWGLNQKNLIIRSQIARGKYTSSQVLDILSQDKNQNVKKEVINNHNTLISTLEVLAQDVDDYIRSLVALQADLPIHTLELLAQDQSRSVRRSVAENISTPDRILNKLATDSEFLVRRYVPTNPNVSQETLKQLIKDKDNYIRYKAAQKLFQILNSSSEQDDCVYLLEVQNIIQEFGHIFT